MLEECRTGLRERVVGHLGTNMGPSKCMDCLCYVYDTKLIAKSLLEAVHMLEVFYTTLGQFGLDVDVPEAGTEIDQTSPEPK